MNRYSKTEVEQFTNDVIRDGFCVLREYFPKPKLLKWQMEFVPLLEAHIKNQDGRENRAVDCSR